MPLSWLSVGTWQGNNLTCNLSGNIRSQLSQHAEPLWTDPAIKSGISSRKIISAKNFFFKCRRGMNGQTFTPKSLQARKKPPPPQLIVHLTNFDKGTLGSLLPPPTLVLSLLWQSCCSACQLFLAMMIFFIFFSEFCWGNDLLLPCDLFMRHM